MDEYLCRKCQKVRPKTDFYIRYNRIITPCKECKASYYKTWVDKNKDYHKKWKKDHLDKIKEYNRKYYQNDRTE